jgi:hypothetical protein
MPKQTKQTVDSLARAAASNVKFISDANITRAIENLVSALQLAHKEIEDLKAQLNQK